MNSTIVIWILIKMCNWRLQRTKPITWSKPGNLPFIQEGEWKQYTTMARRTLFDTAGCLENWKRGQEENWKMLVVWINSSTWSIISLPEEKLSNGSKNSHVTIETTIKCHNEHVKIGLCFLKSIFFTGYKMTYSYISGGVCTCITITSVHIFEIITFLPLTQKNNRNKHLGKDLSHHKNGEFWTCKCS